MTLAPREIIEAPAREWDRYPEYKDSGIEWLGDVPVHWEIQALKHTVKACRNGIWGEEPTGDSDDLVCVRVADFDRTRNRVGDSKLTVRSVPPSQQYGKVLNPGDLLIEKSGGGDLQPVGTVVLYDLDLRAVCSNFVARMPVVADCTPSFLCHLHAALYAGRINTRSIKQNTGIQNLDSKSYLQEKIGLPPLSEQRAIAAFLDRETRKIGDLIARRERLIELLEEKRTALISRAVTKGLDPGVPMKDSGVEWLGEIPEYWIVAPVYSRYMIQLGKMLDQAKFRGADMAPYLRNTNVAWNYVNVDDVSEMEFSPEERRKFSLKPGDLLVCEGGEVGRTAMWRGELPECYFQKAIHRVRPVRDDEEPRFLYYVMYAAARSGVFVAEGNKSTIIHLTAEKLRKHRFPFPSLIEQRVIVEYLDRETKKIDTLAGKLREHIEKLWEYRTALIFAAVTGRIDVREEASAPADREPDKMMG